MKQALLTSFFVLFQQFCCFGQEYWTIKPGNIYKFSTARSQTASPQIPVSEIKTMDKAKAIPIPIYGRVLVESVEADKIIYSYLTYDQNTQSTDYNLYNKGDPQFVMMADQFVNVTLPIYNRYKGANVGIYSVPFRLRGKGDTFDFESSLALQANVVFGFGSRRSNHSWLDGSFGIGLSSINLNNKNSIVQQDRTASALTMSLGALIKFNRFANFGIFLGKDFLNARDRPVNWIYNKKTWVGLGINISFNEISTDSPAKTSTQPE